MLGTWGSKWYRAASELDPRVLYQMMGHNAPVVKQRSPCKELFERALYHSAEQTEEQEHRYLLFSAVMGYRLLSALPQKCHACSLVAGPCQKPHEETSIYGLFFPQKGKAYLYYSCKTRLNRTVSAQWPRLPTYLKFPSFNYFTAKKTPQLSTRDSRTKHCRRRLLLYFVNSGLQEVQLGVSSGSAPKTACNHTPLCKVLAVPRKHTLPISRKMELRIPRFCQNFFHIWIWTCVAHNRQIKTGAQPVSGTKKAKFTKNCYRTFWNVRTAVLSFHSRAISVQANTCSGK